MYTNHDLSSDSRKKSLSRRSLEKDSISYIDMLKNIKLTLTLNLYTMRAQVLKFKKIIIFSFSYFIFS